MDYMNERSAPARILNPSTTNKARTLSFSSSRSLSRPSLIAFSLARGEARYMRELGGKKRVGEGRAHMRCRRKWVHIGVSWLREPMTGVRDQALAPASFGSNMTFFHQRWLRRNSIRRFRAPTPGVGLPHIGLPSPPQESVLIRKYAES